MGIKRTDRRLQASMTEFFKAQDHNNGLMTEQDFKGLLLNGFGTQSVSDFTCITKTVGDSRLCTF
jgi:hypothetical protein